MKKNIKKNKNSKLERIKTNKTKKNIRRAKIKGKSKNMLKKTFLVLKKIIITLFLIIKFLFNILLKITIFLYNVIKNTIQKIKTKLEEKKIERKQKTTEEKINEETKKEKNNHYDPLIIVKKVKGNINKFENLIYKKSSIGIILGARGTGKSALGLKLLENYHYKTLKELKNKKITKKEIRKLFALGFENSNLPYYIQKIKDPVFLEENSIVLLDESGITFSSRKGFSDINKLMSELILISRHKNLSLIFITQNSSNLEVNILRQADYLMLKPSSLLQLDFERKKIKKIYEKIKEDYEKYKHIKGITYIYSEEFEGFIKNNLPSFWNENISKSFKNK